MTVRKLVDKEDASHQQTKYPNKVTHTCTGGIEKFSAKENLGKILKVSHFYLGFSPYENNDEIRHHAVNGCFCLISAWGIRTSVPCLPSKCFLYT